MKNNLCAYQDGDLAPITRLTFDRLQALTPSKTALPWGSRTNIPTSDAARLQLQGLYTTTNGDTVGEGSYVQLVAFILEGRTSFTGCLFAIAAFLLACNGLLTVVTASARTNSVCDRKAMAMTLAIEQRAAAKPDSVARVAPATGGVKRERAMAWAFAAPSNQLNKQA